MIAIGVDLSGPGNTADTALVEWEFEEGDHCPDRDRPALTARVSGVTDLEIWNRVAAALERDEVVVGLDAPLSYQPGGGDRPGDSALRRVLVARGLPSGSVMPPTLTRMIYLTARGMAVARGVEQVVIGGRRARIVEVHPSGALVLRGADVQAVRVMKREASARATLFKWLRRQGLGGPNEFMTSDMGRDHLIAACAAAWAARDWARERPLWLWPAQPPEYPFDYAC